MGAQKPAEPEHDARAVFDGTDRVVELVGHGQKFGPRFLGHALGKRMDIRMDVVFTHNNGSRLRTLFADHFRQMNALGKRRSDFLCASRMFGDLSPALDVFVGCGIDERHGFKTAVAI